MSPNPDTWKPAASAAALLESRLRDLRLRCGRYANVTDHPGGASFFKALDAALAEAEAVCAEFLEATGHSPLPVVSFDWLRATQATPTRKRKR